MGRAISKSMSRTMMMMMTTTKKKNSAVGRLLRRTSTPHLHNPSCLSHQIVPPKSHLCPFSFNPLRFFSTNFSDDIRDEASEEGETTDDGWEEEDDSDPMIGDGGDGGGVALHDVPWGQRALSIAEDVLKQFNEDIELYAFKTTPRGYVYVRLDKLTNEDSKLREADTGKSSSSLGVNVSEQLGLGELRSSLNSNFKCQCHS